MSNLEKLARWIDETNNQKNLERYLKLITVKSTNNGNNSLAELQITVGDIATGIDVP